MTDYYIELNSETKKEKIAKMKLSAYNGDYSSSFKLANYYFNKAVDSKTEEDLLENGKNCFEYAIMYIKQNEKIINEEAFAFYSNILINTKENLVKLFLTDDRNYYSENLECCLNCFKQKIFVLRALENKKYIEGEEKSPLNIGNRDLFSPKHYKRKEDVYSTNKELTMESNNLEDINIEKSDNAEKRIGTKCQPW